MSLVPQSLRTMLAGHVGGTAGPVPPPFPIPPRNSDQWLGDPAFGNALEFSPGHNRWIVRDASRTGDRRSLRAGHARRFDGIATQFNFAPLQSTNQVTILLRVFHDPAGDDDWQTYWYAGASDDFNSFAWFNRSNVNNIQFRAGGQGNGTGWTEPIPSGVWVWLALRFDNGEARGWVNDAVVDWTIPTPNLTIGAVSQLGRLGNTSNEFVLSGSVAEFRIWPEALEDAEILAARDHDPQVRVPAAFYKCDEEAGPTMYSSVGGNHAGLQFGLPWEPTIDADTNRDWSWANEVGHGVSGQVIIPRSETDPSQDALGNPLLYAGAAPRDATLRTRMVSIDPPLEDCRIPASFPLSLTTWTVGLWARRLTVSATNKTLIQREDSANRGFRLFLQDSSDSSLRFQVGSPSSVVDEIMFDTGSSPSDLTWHHYAISYDSASRRMRLYYDGELADEILHTTGGANEAAITYLANFREGAQPLRGQFGNLLFVNREMPQSEIADAARNASNLEAIRAIDGLVDYFPCQDDQGDEISFATVLSGIRGYSASVNAGFQFAWENEQAEFNAWPYVQSCPSFNFANQSIDMRNEDVLPTITDADFSVSIFIRPRTGQADMWVIGNSNSLNTPGWQMRMTSSGDTVRFGVLSSIGNYRLVDSSALDLSRWNHILGTWERFGQTDRARIFVNGVEDNATRVENGTLTQWEATTPTTIGKNPDGPDDWFFRGEMVDARIYPEQLTQSNAVYLASNGREGSPPATQPVRHLDLTEDSGNLYFDHSAFRQHGEVDGNLSRSRQAVYAPPEPSYTRSITLAQPSDHIAVPQDIGFGTTIAVSFLIGRVEADAIGQIINRGAAGDFNWQLRVRVGGGLEITQFQASGSGFRSFQIPDVFSTWKWSTVKVEWSDARADVWIDGVQTSNTVPGSGVWNNAGGVLRVGERVDGDDAGVFSIKNIAISHTLTGEDREDYSRSHPDDLMFLTCLETSATDTNVRDVSGFRRDGTLNVASIVDSRSQRCGLALPPMSPTPLPQPGQVIDHYAENLDSPWAARMLAAGLPQFLDVRDDQDFESFGTHAFTVGNAGFLYGFRPQDHPTNQFGDLVPDNRAGDRVWQLTGNPSSDVVVVDFGVGGGTNVGPDVVVTLIDQDASLVVPWDSDNNRYQTTDTEFVAAIVAEEGNTIQLDLSNRIRFCRLRADGMDRIIVDTRRQNVTGLRDYTREEP